MFIPLRDRAEVEWDEWTADPAAEYAGVHERLTAALERLAVCEVADDWPFTATRDADDIVTDFDWHATPVVELVAEVRGYADVDSVTQRDLALLGDGLELEGCPALAETARNLMRRRRWLAAPREKTSS
jgi:hypothetical protein